MLASLTEGHRLYGAGASAVVTHRCSYPMAHGIFSDQGLNPCPLHWQVDSLPLAYHGSPGSFFKKLNVEIKIQRCKCGSKETSLGAVAIIQEEVNGGLNHR